MNTRNEDIVRKSACAFLGKPDRDYAEIGNRTPHIPHGDLQAAWDDIAHAVGYLIGQGINVDDIKLTLASIVDHESGAIEVCPRCQSTEQGTHHPLCQARDGTPTALPDAEVRAKLTAEDLAEWKARARDRGFASIHEYIDALRDADERTRPPSKIEVDSILAQVDLMDLVQEQVPLLRSSNNECHGMCPFCKSDDRNSRLLVNRQKAFFHCFACGAHGTALDWIMKRQGLAIREAFDVLRARLIHDQDLPF